MKLTSVNPPGHVQHQIFQDFAAAVEKRTGGRCQIEVIQGPVLHTLTEGFDALKKGIADITYNLTAYNRALFPLSEISTLPLASPNPLVTARVFEELYPKYMKSEWEKTGIKFIAEFGNPNVQLITKKPVRKLADLQGLKIRGSGTQTAVLKLLGASPVTMDVGELYMAIQTGTLDGTLYILATASTTFKFDEVAKYVTMMEVQAPAPEIGIRAAVVDALPSDIKDIMYEEARKMTIANALAYIRMDKEGAKVWKDRGGEIIQLPSDEVSQLRDIVSPLWQTWSDNMEKKGLPGKQLVADWRALVDKYSRLSNDEVVKLWQTNPIKGIW